jgi:hypothetical protein
MAHRMRLVAVAAVTAVVVATWWQGGESPKGDAAPALSTAGNSPTRSPAQPSPPPGLQVAASAAVTAMPVPMPPAAAVQTPANDERTFRTDDKGRLVLDERTRLAVEKLVGLNGPESLAALVAEQTSGLPAEAAAQARDLVERYGAYESARRGTFEPGTAPMVPEEGLAELAATRALRASYFGQDAAQRLFGAEEAVSKRLLEMMRDDRAANLTIEQKAIRAQARYSLENPGP